MAQRLKPLWMREMEPEVWGSPERERNGWWFVGIVLLAVAVWWLL